MSDHKDPGGVYVVSVRKGVDRPALRSAAYAHVGLDTEGVDFDRTTLADSFTAAGFDVEDLTRLIDHLTGLGVDPTSVPGQAFRAFDDRSGIDDEGRPTDVFMVAVGGDTGTANWLACVGPAHATWPRLLPLLGASVGGTLMGEEGVDHLVRVPEIRVPKALRLKSGWDYDAEGNQVRLPLEEAWRRFVVDNENRDEDQKMSQRMMHRMRCHMEQGYADRAQCA